MTKLRMLVANSDEKAKSAMSILEKELGSAKEASAKQVEALKE